MDKDEIRKAENTILTNITSSKQTGPPSETSTTRTLRCDTPAKSFGLKPRGGEVIKLNQFNLGGVKNKIFSDWLFTRPEGRGYYITGPSRSGKTSFAIALANEYNKRIHLERFKQWKNESEDDRLNYFAGDEGVGEILFFDRVYAIDWYNLKQAYNLFLEKRSQVQQSMVDACEAPNGRLLWIIDDFGGGYMSAPVREATETFIRNLYSQSATVIITSNVEMDAARDIWNDQIRSRLVEMCVQVKLTGKDRRGA